MSNNYRSCESPNVIIDKKEYKRLKRLEEILSILKFKASYNEEEMKFTIEIEPDDFESSEEWDRFKEVIKCKN